MVGTLLVTALHLASGIPWEQCVLKASCAFGHRDFYHFVSFVPPYSLGIAKKPGATHIAPRAGILGSGSDVFGQGRITHRPLELCIVFLFPLPVSRLHESRNAEAAGSFGNVKYPFSSVFLSELRNDT